MEPCLLITVSADPLSTSILTSESMIHTFVKIGETFLNIIVSTSIVYNGNS